MGTQGTHTGQYNDEDRNGKSRHGSGALRSPDLSGEWSHASCSRAKLDTGPDAPFLPEKDDSSGQTDIDLFRYYSTSYLSAMIEN